ncbi:MAG: RluA family pseudouridine synthase [Peptoniphilaceae bacterium]|nr:RluA family pseudouridine synthase [Peptoniphilaceae bacterium]MDY6018021.1 RluA family pseudouridine synthase [Anaerococcus sp.]
MSTIKLISKKEISLKELLKENYISKRASIKLINKGLLINGEISFGNRKLKVGDTVEIPITEENIDYEPIKGKLDILYEDDQIIIINKASGITMNSKNQVNLSNIIAYYFVKNNINRKIRLINRLDMNTSGIMLIAKNKYAQSYYQKEIENNRLVKKYLAIVEGKLEINEKVKINITYDKDNKFYYHSQKGIEAVTIFNTIKANDKYSLVEANILTGKTHQIRASLRHLKHPIIGDYLYGSKYELDRFLLHSYYLEFREFITGQEMIIKSKPDFEKYMKKLGLS